MSKTTVPLFLRIPTALDKRLREAAKACQYEISPQKLALRGLELAIQEVTREKK